MVRAGLLGIAVAVAILGWGVPNLAGPAFIEVQLVAVPIAGSAVAPPRTIILGDGKPVLASRLRFDVRVDGRYFLPLIVGATGAPLRVELRTRSEDGSARLVWGLEGSAAALEEGADSPDGPTSSRAYLVRTGPTDLPIGPADGAALLDAAGRPLDPGRYDLRAVAFGVASAPLQMVLVD